MAQNKTGPCFFLSTKNGNKFKGQQELGALICSTVSIATAVHATLLL